MDTSSRDKRILDACCSETRALARVELLLQRDIFIFSFVLSMIYINVKTSKPQGCMSMKMSCCLIFIIT